VAAVAASSFVADRPVMLSSVTLYGHAIYPRVPCLASGGAAENVVENRTKDRVSSQLQHPHWTGAIAYIVI
jgi:hypothetical protein